MNNLIIFIVFVFFTSFTVFASSDTNAKFRGGFICKKSSLILHSLGYHQITPDPDLPNYSGTVISAEDHKHYKLSLQDRSIIVHDVKASESMTIGYLDPDTYSSLQDFCNENPDYNGCVYDDIETSPELKTLFLDIDNNRKCFFAVKFDLNHYDITYWHKNMQHTIYIERTDGPFFNISWASIYDFKTKEACIEYEEPLGK